MSTPSFPRRTAAPMAVYIRILDSKLIIFLKNIPYLSTTTTTITALSQICLVLCDAFCFWSLRPGIHLDSSCAIRSHVG